MRKILTFAIIAIIMGCKENKCQYDSLQRDLDEMFAQRYSDADAPGAAIVIARGDSVIYERYFGVADLSTGERVSDSTLFNIASVSKQFTVVALLKQGVDIKSPVSEFFDYQQPFWREVTLEHLASHTSGLPDSRDRSDRDRCVYANDSSSMEYFPFVDSLKFSPGTAYDYLNPSFLLLAAVVEQKSGMAFVDYMRQCVFNPLGMEHTVYFSPQSMPKHTAHAYVPDGNGGWQIYEYGQETFFATRPDGGIYSTARDMLKWERGLAAGAVLDPATLKDAYTPRVSVSDSPWCDYQRRPNTAYALGWFVDTTPGFPTKVYHTGDNGGFQAYVAKYPEKDICIIILENRNDLSRWAMARSIDGLLRSHRLL